MFVAQRLYEGVSIEDKMVGLITYMRTDSFHIAPKAKKEAGDFIKEHFGRDYLPFKEYHYKEKKGAQLAHEAIRPTSCLRSPEKIKEFLDSDEEKLYDLIWRRFLASFMREALFEHTKVLIISSSAEFAAEGKKMIFEGYLKLIPHTDGDLFLPSLDLKQQVSLFLCEVVSHITKPPPRFNDASLVRVLEEKGIGRPSTYAPIISTLLLRNYVRRNKGAFVPTELGIKVNNYLLKHFSEIINEDFTAFIEGDLDRIE